MIKQIIDSDEKMKFKVGVDGVTEIELTNHGNKKTSIYKITYGNDYYEYIGLLESHEVIN